MKSLSSASLTPAPTTVNNDAGDRSFAMNQTNNITLGAGDDPGRIAGHLNAHAGTMLRNAKAIIT